MVINWLSPSLANPFLPLPITGSHGRGRLGVLCSPASPQATQCRAQSHHPQACLVEAGPARTWVDSCPSPGCWVQV